MQTYVTILITLTAVSFHFITNYISPKIIFLHSHCLPLNSSLTQKSHMYIRTHTVLTSLLNSRLFLNLSQFYLLVFWNWRSSVYIGSHSLSNFTQELSYAQPFIILHSYRAQLFILSAYLYTWEVFLNLWHELVVVVAVKLFSISFSTKSNRIKSKNVC